MGAITAAVIGAGTALYSTQQQKKSQKEATKAAKEMQSAADPYAQYRPEAAKRLDDLATGKTDISTTANYKARLQAAERQSAAQGYTGSGNALVAAAEAGAAAYQQEFDNLAMLAGAGSGTSNAVSAGSNTLGAMQNQADAKASGAVAIGNQLSNLAQIGSSLWNKTPAQSSAIAGSSGSFIPQSGSAGSSFFNFGGG